MAEAAAGLGEQVGGIYYDVSLDTAEMVRGQREVDKAVQKVDVSLTEVARATKTYAAALQLEAAIAREAAKAEAGLAAAQGKTADAAAKGAGAMGKTALSAKQLSAATRGLPAQFTDIFTSIASGQNPLQVLLQQGGQLKDMFGGIGPAVGAMGRYIVGLVNPVTAAAAAVVALVTGWAKGQQESAEFTRSIELSGNASGVTADQLNTMAAGLDKVSGITRGKAAEALNTLVSVGVQGGQALGRYAEAAIRLEQVGGDSVEKTAKAFKSLEADPVRASLKLNESVNFLTGSLYKQITALDQQGKRAEAAKVAQQAYADAILLRTPKIEEGLGSLERAWRAVTSAAKNGWDALLDIGRKATPEERIDATKRQIADLERQLQGGGFATTAGGAATGRGMGQRERQQKEALLESLREQVRLYGKSAMAASDVADADAKRKAQVEALADFDRQGERFIDKRARMEREIAQARELGKQAGLSELQIEQRIAAIRTSYTEKKDQTKFDAVGYLIGLQEKAVEGYARIDAAEREAMHRADELRKEGKISVQQFEDAKTLIAADAADKRRQLWEQEKSDAIRIFEEGSREIQREREQRNKGREFARDILIGNDPIAQAQAEHEAKSKLLLQYAEQDQAYAQSYAEARVALEQQTAERIRQILAQQEQDRLSMQSAALAAHAYMFDSLADITRTFAGEQSGIYKAMFAVSKAFAIASALINIQQAISSAPTGLPFPASLAAMGTVAASMASIVGNIQAITFRGGRRYGGPAEAGSLYRVNEGGRPEMFTANNGAQYMLPTKSGNVTPAGAGGGMKVVVNNYAGAEVRTSQGSDGSAIVDIERRMVNAVASDTARGGVTARATSGRLGLNNGATLNRRRG